MGCGSSKSDEPPQQQGRPQQQQMGQPRREYGGWGVEGSQVKVEPPAPNDPPFMKTAAPSGTTWSQYCRTGGTFIDPATGYLAGPWAECISWGCVFEHTNDWGSMPEYAADGPIGGILQALDSTLQGNPNKAQFMAAADRLEAASHALAENGQPLPAIKQVVTLPQDVQPGQVCVVDNPQTPGTTMQIQAPPNAQPGQAVTAPAPQQPNAKGHGMSTGAKVGFALGGAALIGGCAYAGAMAGEAGAFDGAIDVGGDVAQDVMGFGESGMDMAWDGAGDAGDALMDLF